MGTNNNEEESSILSTKVKNSNWKMKIVVGTPALKGPKFNYTKEPSNAIIEPEGQSISKIYLFFFLFHLHFFFIF